MITSPLLRGRLGTIGLAITLVLLAVCLWLEGKRLIIKPFPPTYFHDAVADFKYGSIGAETNGFPYEIWQELPTIFRDKIPGGWHDFGFIFEPGRDLPIGLSVRRTAVNRVGFNCATCHTAQIEVAGKPEVILGAPAAQLDLQAYLKFILMVSEDPGLTADAVIESAASNGRPLGWINRQALKWFVMPELKKQAHMLARSFAWMDVKAPHGPGRTDAGNTWRERWGMHPETDTKVGTVDFPSVWNQRARLNGWFHWDGNNNSLSERNYSAALAGGATDWLLDRRKIGEISDWLVELQPPRFPGTLDPGLVTSGRKVYTREKCEICHDPGIGRTGQVTDLDLIGTDPERAALFDDEMVRRFSQVGKGYTWQFKHYRSSHGYANMPLDGIWARAPYLHNGSVPDLASLLDPPADRPGTFYRGCATFDVERVGYACTEGFLFDSAKTGNGNQGHLYGTALSKEDKAALLAYLKSL
ncbi:hypothetical protein [Mesorhizobium sp. L48C026A00]|uniref:c-type cytochrome n=1 Tax=Mesorhizobium sp. L48C026A00 TaxID=1287182 RepID=UPI0003D04015|nr:hypothetical protein [Mesorhizobium sp. L48C026A00]ESZ15227.1 hypothetical protein X737_22105 [Mesorhizobium sp. L48C026A00]